MCVCVYARDITTSYRYSSTRDRMQKTSLSLFVVVTGLVRKLSQCQVSSRSGFHPSSRERVKDRVIIMSKKKLIHGQQIKAGLRI